MELFQAQSIDFSKQGEEPCDSTVLSTDKSLPFFFFFFLTKKHEAHAKLLQNSSIWANDSIPVILLLN